MTTASDQPRVRAKAPDISPSEVLPRRRAVIAASIGHFVEFYDYSVYGFFAAAIGTHFFPSKDPAASLLASFATFALAFGIRPIGGIVFGHFGDKVGRRNVLATSVLLMGLGSLLLALLPSYASIGVWAPVLLVVARLAQGFSVGAENAGAATFLIEYAPSKRRGFFCSLSQVAVIGALLAGSGLAALMHGLMTEETITQWGWRLPFLLGAALSFVGLYLRLRLADTPAFERLSREAAVQRAPLAYAVTHHWRTLLVGAGYYIAPAAAGYFLLIYMPTYASKVFGLPEGQALLSNVLALGLLFILIPVQGALSDRYGRKPLLIIFTAGLAVCTLPLVLLFAQGTFLAILAAQLVFAVLVSFFYGPGMAMGAELYPVEFRYTGLALSNNIATSAFGGTAPFIGTWLVSRTGSAISPAFYLVFAGLASFFVVARMKETADIPLSDSQEIPHHANR